MTRIDRLRDELIENGVVDQFNASEKAIFPQLVEELEHAMFPPVHEGKTPTYGCLIVAKRPESVVKCIDASKMEIATSREMANGKTSVAIRHQDIIPLIVCFESPQDEELLLVKLRNKWGGIFVHRSEDETVSVFKETTVFSFRKGNWSQRPYSNFVVTKVHDSVPQCDYSVLSGLLEFAVHSLSPARVGATLVWWFRQVPNELPDASIDFSKSILHAANNEHYGALRSLLSQHDGATFLSPESKLISIGAHLKYSDKANTFVPMLGGTRHTSAKRFTFDNSAALAIVVSEDGPVSIFSDGAKIAELHEEPVGSTEQLLSSLVPEKANDVVTDEFEKTCENCGKKVSVEVVIVYGMKERESGWCPVCRKVIHEQNCHLIFTRMRKHL